MYLFPNKNRLTQFPRDRYPQTLTSTQRLAQPSLSRMHRVNPVEVLINKALQNLSTHPLPNPRPFQSQLPICSFSSRKKGDYLSSTNSRYFPRRPPESQHRYPSTTKFHANKVSNPKDSRLDQPTNPSIDR